MSEELTKEQQDRFDGYPVDCIIDELLEAEAQLAGHEWVRADEPPKDDNQVWIAYEQSGHTYNGYYDKVCKGWYIFDYGAIGYIRANAKDLPTHWKPIHLPGAKAEKEPSSSFIQYLREQREWSRETFGTGRRTNGLIDHIKKELIEISDNPTDLFEWIDVVTLALDGAWRAGWSENSIYEALWRKLTINKNRQWNIPDCEDKAVEHIHLPVAEADPEVCEWKHNDRGLMDTNCGHVSEIPNNIMKFCTYCGIEIKEVE